MVFLSLSTAATSNCGVCDRQRLYARGAFAVFGGAWLVALAAAVSWLRRWGWARSRRNIVATCPCVAVRFKSTYAADVVRDALRDRGLQEDDSAACQLGEFAHLDWDEFLEGCRLGGRCSCLYLRAGLVRKGMLTHYLAKRRVGGVLPPSFVADLEDAADIDGLEKQLQAFESQNALRSTGSKTSRQQPQWIAKASASNRGENLVLGLNAVDICRTLRAVALEGGIVEWVVQQYITSPVLLNGRKFHVRAHFLVSGCPICGISHAWLHHEMHVVLAASVPYDLESQEFADDRLRHLTNHCLQEVHPAYEEVSQIFLLEELDSVIGSPGLAAHVLVGMERALAEALRATEKAPAAFAPLPQCFELFGADFILEDLGPASLPGVWLLEVNAGPDLAVFGSRLRSHCVRLWSDVLQLAVEPFLQDDPATSFANPDSCICGRKACLRSDGFGDAFWSGARPPSAASALEALQGFKHRLSVASRWARSLHERSGVELRGSQAEVAVAVEGAVS